MTKQQRIWLLNLLMDRQHLMAESGGAKDLKLSALEADGILINYDSMFKNNYYELTKKGRSWLANGKAK